MRNTLRFVLVACVLGFGATARGEAPTLQGSVSVREGDRTLTMPYRLMQPDGLTAGDSAPLVVFLHGAGERGTDGDAALRHIAPVLGAPAMRKKHACFVLAVQCPRDMSWVETGARSQNPALTAEPSMPMRGVISAIEQVMRDRAVDRHRVYLTGLSLGGYGAWDLAMRRPDLFAAVVPVCGGGDPTKVDALKGMPIQVWHGSDDASVPVQRSREMVQALKDAGITVDYHEIRNGGHDAWTQAYLPDTAIAFMFRQVQESSPPAPKPTPTPNSDAAPTDPAAR